MGGIMKKTITVFLAVVLVLTLGLQSAVFAAEADAPPIESDVTSEITTTPEPEETPDGTPGPEETPDETPEPGETPDETPEPAETPDEATELEEALVTPQDETPVPEETLVTPQAVSYEISTPAELLKIGGDYPLNADYTLTADIDLNGIPWEPIDGFTGNFDGQNHVIRNMTIIGDHAYAGLFGHISGAYIPVSQRIQNLGLVDVNIDVTVVTNTSVGGLIGYNQRGHIDISNCYVTGQIKATGNSIHAGGLVGASTGYNPTGVLNITDCYNEAEVTANATTFSGILDAPVVVAGTAVAGGIIAIAHDAQTISNCRNTGEVTANSSGGGAAGGIAAVLYKNNIVRNGSNMGDVAVVSAGEEHYPSQEFLYVSAGGIIGFNTVNDTMSTTIGCYNAGDISAQMSAANDHFEIFAGGIGGRVHEQTLSDCYNTGAVLAANPAGNLGYAGGIVGRNSTRSSVRRCYSIGSISGALQGGTVGLAEPGSVIRDNSWLSSSAPKGVAQGAGESGTTALPAAQMKQEGSFPAFNFTNTWGFKEGENDGYPVLQAFYPGWTYTPTSPATLEPSRDFLAPIGPPKEGSYGIGTAEDLRKIGQPEGLPLSWNYHLTADIDLKGIDWVPIGTSQTDSFTGIFDGQGHAIHNLEVTSDHQYAGLFGIIGYAGNGAPVIKNLGLENVSIRAADDLEAYAGGLVGYSWQSDLTISNCYATGEVTATGGRARAGGLLGYTFVNYAGKYTFTDCFNAAAVTAVAAGNTTFAADAGGVIGRVQEATTIRNCHNEGTVTSKSIGFCSAGGVVAWLSDNDTLSACSNTGRVNAISSGGEYISAGGIVGYNATNDDMSTIETCYNSGDISAELTNASSYTEVFAGGIGGRPQQIALRDCYNTGDVNATSADNTRGNAGGIVGRSSANSSVRRSYNTGDVSASQEYGGIVGLAVAGSFTKDCFWNAPVQVNQKGIGSGEDTTTPLTTMQMKQEASFAGFSFGQVWAFQSGENGGHPVLQVFYPGMAYTPTTPPPAPVPDFIATDFDPPAAGSIPIATREDLDSIRNNLGGTYHLTADIDLSGVDWTPIGVYSQWNSTGTFTGVFDGQGHVITGLEIVALPVSTTGIYSGLFGFAADNAAIRNVGLENACIFSTAWRSYAGGLVGGFRDMATVNNCYVNGQITCIGTETQDVDAGGIAGYVTGTTPEIVDCHTAVKLTVGGNASPYAGGIVGLANAGRVFNCRSTGDVAVSKPSSTSSGAAYAGGIAGDVTKAEITLCRSAGRVTAATSSMGYAGGITGRIDDANGSVLSSYNTGDVSITVSGASPTIAAGGIVGQNSGKVNDCYNRGKAAAASTAANVYAGGIVGNSLAGASVARCYSTGDVTGTNLGGVAGAAAATATITDSFWNNESTQTVGAIVLPAGNKKGIGTGAGSAVGLTTAQMKEQTSFAGFDFSAVWNMVSGQNDNYPVQRAKEFPYAVTTQRGTGSTGTVTGGGNYVKGTSVTLVAPNPSTNFRFKEWTSTAADVVFANKNSMETTFVMPGKSITVTATYESIPSHTVTVVGGTGGGSKREDAIVTIYASPPSGKTLKEWRTDDVVLDNKNISPTTFRMPAKDVTVTAIYEDILYAVTVNNGTASPSTAAVGTTVTITADAPAAGKRFKLWTTYTSGITFGNASNAQTTFTMPAKAVTVSATYENVVKESRAAPAAPTLASKTSTAVTLNKIAGAEYRRGSGAWQDSPVFSGLSPNTAYTFAARMKETDTHNASPASASLLVQTNKTKPTTSQLTYSLTSKTYNGKAQGVKVTPRTGVGAVTVKYNGSTTVPKNAGTYSVTADVAAGTNYSAASNLALGSYTINKANLSGSVVSVASKVWSGKQIRPAVPSFTLNGITFATTGVAITYGANKNIGKGTLTLTGGGNFTGKKTVTFKIVPKKNSVATITPAKKQMKVTWKKTTAAQNISRYEVRWREKGTSKWQTKTFAASASSATIKNLTKGKNYQVQVRSYKTVSGTKYYSAWSTTKTSNKIK